MAPLPEPLVDGMPPLLLVDVGRLPLPDPEEFP
jgi:hypothetical protein